MAEDPDRSDSSSSIDSDAASIFSLASSTWSSTGSEIDNVSEGKAREVELRRGEVATIDLGEKTPSREASPPPERMAALGAKTPSREASPSAERMAALGAKTTSREASPAAERPQPARTDSVLSAEMKRYEAAKADRASAEMKRYQAAKAERTGSWKTKIKARVLTRLQNIQQACGKLGKEIFSSAKQEKVHGISSRQMERIPPSNDADPNTGAAHRQREENRSAASPEIVAKRQREIAEMNVKISEFRETSDNVMQAIISKARRELPEPQDSAENNVTPQRGAALLNNRTRDRSSSR